MQLDNLIAHIIATCPTAAQVLKAEDIDREFVDTSNIIYNLVKDSVSGRAYPGKMPKEKTFPALVYDLVSSNKVSYSQFNILQADVFVLYFQAETYSEIMTLRETIKSDLVNYYPTDSGGDIEITDESISYLYEQGLYQCALELSIVHLNGSNQALPAILVFESADSAAPNDMLNTVAQWREVDLSFNVIAKHEDLDAMRNELEASVLGYRENNMGAGSEYTRGGRLESLINMTVWEERYALKLRPMIANR